MGDYLKYKFEIDMEEGQVHRDDMKFDIQQHDTAKSTKYLGNLGQLLEWAWVFKIVFGVELLTPVNDINGRYKWVRDIDMEDIPTSEPNTNQSKQTRPKHKQILLKVNTPFYIDLCSLMTNNEEGGAAADRSWKNLCEEWKEKYTEFAGRLQSSLASDSKTSIDFDYNSAGISTYEGKLGGSLKLTERDGSLGRIKKSESGVVELNTSPAIMSLLIGMGASEVTIGDDSRDTRLFP